MSLFISNYSDIGIFTTNVVLSPCLNILPANNKGIIKIDLFMLLPDITCPYVIDVCCHGNSVLAVAPVHVSLVYFH